MIQKIQKLSPSCKREPLSRLWFLSRGYKQADPRYTNGYALWIHPRTNDVLTRHGYKLKLNIHPKEKHLKTNARYLELGRQYGSMLLARLKYLTFKGGIPAGYTIDHIDGNSMNNDIRNLRAVPAAINQRDGGFMRKLRNNGIHVAMYRGIILEGYERMAQFKNTHSERAYRNLKGKELLQVFIGPSFTVMDPDVIMDLDFTQHREF